LFHGEVALVYGEEGPIQSARIAVLHSFGNKEVPAPFSVRIAAHHSFKETKMSAEITPKLHRPNLAVSKGNDADYSRDHVTGPAKSTEPAKAKKSKS